MTIREIEIFVCVANCGQMTEAARLLSVSQSSVSQVIASLEKTYDVCLFFRLGKQLILTDTGKSFFQYAQNFLALSAEMESFLRQESIKLHLKLGASVTVGTCLISSLVSKLEQQQENILTEVHITNTHIVETMLLNGDIDIALVEGNLNSPDLICDVIMDDDLVLICSKQHPFCGRRCVHIDELNGQHFILRERGSGTRAQFEDQLLEKNIEYLVKWNCTCSEAIINAVVDNHGISVISRRLAQQKYEEGQLWMCSIDNLQLTRRFSLVYHKNKRHTKVMEMFSSICKSIDEL